MLCCRESGPVNFSGSCSWKWPSSNVGSVPACHIPAWPEYNASQNRVQLTHRAPSNQQSAEWVNPLAMANQFNSALNMNSLPRGSFVIKQFTGKAEEDNDELAFRTSLSNGRPKREGKPRSARILTERRNPVISNVVLIECTAKMGTVHGVTIQNCKYICFSFYISKKWYYPRVKRIFSHRFPSFFFLSSYKCWRGTLKIKWKLSTSSSHLKDALREMRRNVSWVLHLQYCVYSHQRPHLVETIFIRHGLWPPDSLFVWY